MRFVARVLFSCIEGWFKEKRPETDLIESVSGCKSTLNSVFLFSDTVFFNYVFYFTTSTCEIRVS